MCLVERDYLTACDLKGCKLQTLDLLQVYSIHDYPASLFPNAVVGSLIPYHRFIS